MRQCQERIWYPYFKRFFWPVPSNRAGKPPYNYDVRFKSLVDSLDRLFVRLKNPAYSTKEATVNESDVEFAFRVLCHSIDLEMGVHARSALRRENTTRTHTCNIAAVGEVCA